MIKFLGGNLGLGVPFPFVLNKTMVHKTNIVPNRTTQIPTNRVATESVSNFE
jgi:hypothetical protein